MTNTPAAGFSMSQIHSHLCRLALGTILGILSLQPAQAQTYTVLHSFNLLGTDGARPYDGFISDRAGNLYGTTAAGGTNHGGTVFKMVHTSRGWMLNTLYDFADGSDGASPDVRVTMGADGALYGTNTAGAEFGGGVIFKLQVPTRALGEWTETSLYAFAFEQNEYGSPLTFDSAGKLYGAVAHWSGNDRGAVYQLVRNGNSWILNLIYQFAGGNDGSDPRGSLAIDAAGNIYGVTEDDGRYGNGNVYELSPSGSGWTKTVLHDFQGGNDGLIPFGGLIFDHSGNLLGSTGSGGPGNGGTVFQLSPQPGGGWTYSLVYGFPGQSSWGPTGSLTVDQAGNIYGARNDPGTLGNNGSIFELTYSDGVWNYINLHSFAGFDDGAEPNGSLVVDGTGNVYGTAGDGGAYDYGLVFEITP
ncbi:MAG TPA: choice-of-anchor tandem repeat GloVer-containing protein [Candidatus Bathyarchaeia archaeon]|nr:choice-of-anchor tandem repeat GloVer-containing protein [Candidatus Bathyarchaeia archaeon]